jgi:hypothetical protein
MDRNSTNFPSRMTAALRRTYEQYVRMREGLGGDDDKSRMAAVLKYYQYLVVEHLRSLDHQAGPDTPRGVLLYHLMGMGKTFEAVAAALVATSALDLGEPARQRQVILVADKSLHANFSKALDHFLGLLLPDDETRRETIKAKATKAVRMVTLNAHNMADQVLKATTLRALTHPKGAKTGEADPRGALDGAMLIVDEAHNFFRAIINSANAGSNARRLFAMVMSARDLRIVFMTGTPSSKHPFELVPCFNMLAGREVLPVQYDIFVRTFIDTARMRMKNRNIFSNRIVGLVSYAGYEIPSQLENAAGDLKADGDESTPVPTTGGADMARHRGRHGKARQGKGRPDKARPGKGRRPESSMRELTLADLTAAERAAVSAWYRPIEEVEAADGRHVFVFEGPEFRAHALVRPAGSAEAGGMAPPGEHARWVDEVRTCPGCNPECARVAIRAAVRIVRADATTARAAVLSEPDMAPIYAQSGFAHVPGGAPGGRQLMLSQFTFALYDYVYPDMRPLLNAGGEWREVSIRPGDPMPDRVDFAWAESIGKADRRWKTRYFNVPAGLKNALEMDKRAVSDKSRLNGTLEDLHKRGGPGGYRPAIPMSQYVPATRVLADVDSVEAPLIIKDPESWSQRGVIVVSDDAGLRAAKRNPKYVVCQELVRDPLMWRGEDGTWRKFHLRVHMLLYKDRATGAARANLFDLARVLTAGKAYVHGDWDDLDVHLTGAGRTEKKHEWLSDAAAHTEFTSEQVSAAWESVTEVMRIVAHAAAPHLRPYDECDAGFDLFGADIILDARGQAWLIEVNDRVGLGLVGPDNKIGPDSAPDPELIAEVFAWTRDTMVRPHFGLAPWPGEAGAPNVDRSLLLLHVPGAAGPDAVAGGGCGCDATLSSLLDADDQPQEPEVGAPSAVGAAQGRFSFPEKLPTIIREIEMSEQQYRQYLMAREKESSEGSSGASPGGARGAPKPPPAMSLPGSEREGGSTYFVQSRMFGNFAPPREHMPTGSVLDPNSITQVDPRYSPEEGAALVAAGSRPRATHFLPDSAFTADTSPKIAQIMRDSEDSPGPFLVYSQFSGIGGLAVVERFMRMEGYTRFVPDGAAKRGGSQETPRESPRARAVWKDVFGGSTPAERALISKVLEAQDEGRMTFKRSDLLIDIPSRAASAAPPAHTGGELLQYREHKGAMAYRYLNLHRGQRKLFLTELYQFSDELARDGDKHTHPAIVLYAGAAAGYHLPHIAELFPQMQFFLYDPAPFGKAVHKHPRLHVRNQFFTDDTAAEWAPGGPQALRHGRPDFFVCDIRLGAASGDDRARRFEVNVNRDMRAQKHWTETIRPLRSAMLKYRPPYLDTDFMAQAGEKLVRDEDTIRYLKGRVLWQCYPPRLSSETRLIVDCREAAHDPGATLDTCEFPVRFYENMCYTHNVVTRPYVRFVDHSGLFPGTQSRGKNAGGRRGVPGYSGSWDSRAEVEVWKMYIELSRPGRAVADRDIAWRMNGLTKEIHQALHAPGGSAIATRGNRMVSGMLAGMFPRIRGTRFANLIAEHVKTHDLEGQRLRVTGAATYQAARSKAGLTLSSDMQNAVRCYPMTPQWLHHVIEVAQDAQEFQVDRHLAIACGAEPLVPIPKPVPDAVPSDIMCIHRPARAWLLAIVHFLTLKIDSHDARTTLSISTAPAGIDILGELFPLTIVTTDPVEGRRAVLRFADGRSAAALEMHDDPTVCDRCECGAVESYWGCWAHAQSPGTHYHMCELPEGGGAPSSSMAALLRDPAERRDTEMKHVSAHIVYDRSWTRFASPADQDLTAVAGYDSCWDCTAEASIWLEHIRRDMARSGSRKATGRVNIPAKAAGDYMTLLTSYCGEPLYAAGSAHGHITSASAASAVGTACAVLQHNRQQSNIARGKATDVGGGAPPPIPVGDRKYAVYTGDVSVDARAAIQRAWTSPENERGAVIFALLMSKTGAQGLDLKYGRRTFHLEPYWYKSLEDQIDARFIRDGALDDLPPDERTVQPYLYLAVANSAVREAMPDEMLEIPVAASARLPRGTTVDVAFHERALDYLGMNKDTRQVLRASSLECAMYSAAAADLSSGESSQARLECRMCRPTDRVLFHAELDEDLRLPDPCEVMTETSIAATPIVMDGTTYQYVTDPGAALGYRFYQTSEALDFRARTAGEGTDVYVEIGPSDPLYARLVSAVHAVSGVGADELDEFLESL